MQEHQLNWSTLLHWLREDPNSRTNEELAIFTSDKEAEDLCPIGFHTAGLLLTLRGYPDHSSPVKLPTARQLISTAWPFIFFLQSWQKLGSTSLAADPCDTLFHPSIDWSAYRTTLTEGVQHWGQALEVALMDAHGVAWKAGCGAVHQETGLTVSQFTSQCSFGVIATHLIRALGLAIAPPHTGDTLRIMELFLHEFDRYAGGHLAELALNSHWPIPLILHRLNSRAYMNMLRFSLTDHPHEFRPDMFLPDSNQLVVLLHVADAHGNVMKNAINRYSHSIGIAVYVICDSAELHDLCVTQTESESESVCLPVYSNNRLINKYMYINQFLMHNISHTLYHTTDFVPVADKLESLFARLPGNDTAVDMGLLEDLFSRHVSDHVLFIRNTEKARKFVDTMLSYIFKAPFPDERAAVHFILDRPEGFGLVPSVSFLDQMVADVRRFALNELFVTSEGFAKDYPSTVFGVDSHCDSDRLALYEISDSSALAVWLEAKMHGGFVKSRKRFEASSDAIARDLHLFHRADIVSRKRHQEYVVCPLFPVARIQSDIEDAATPIYHINFAHGCCEQDQQLSSASARKYFASESRALRGDILDAQFLERNKELLNFDRSNLITSKTPSGTKGYYIWKPYAILKGICDLPFGSIVVYTDAGVQFKAPFRGLLAKYLRETDLTAVETEMLEQARSKRDAFLILDADHASLATTPQVASAIIAFRKTPNTVDFLEWWLAALESKYVITEEPSVLGAEYGGFVNSNDDQTGFSLLFKKFGYLPFSYRERDQVISMARNVAKFLAASNSFALGQNATIESYKEAADERARSQLQSA